MAVRFLTSIVCTLLLMQVLFSPIALAQSATTTSTTTSSTSASGANLDLNSTHAELTATTSGTIQLNDGSTKTINVNDKITAAEQLALFQILNGGSQSIVLSPAGNAVSGQFHIDSNIASSLSALVVPQGVTAIQTAPNLTLTGNLSNYGSFYAVSTNQQNTTAYISALNIFNYQGAILSTMLPTGGLPGVTGAISNLSLQLTAINNIVNAGTISSAANLTMNAGGSITNALPAGVMGAQPLIQAVNNVNLASNLGNIVNSGIIQSINNNINITSQISNNLVLNNVGGRLEALQGLINVRDSSFMSKFDTTIFGGDILAKELNIFSGEGTVEMNVNKLVGTVNVNAGIAHIVASTDSLSLGSINLTGDPTFYNSLGDIVLKQDLNFSGQHLAIIAVGDIISDGMQVINTSSANAGGSLTIIAGANFQSSGSETVNQPPAPGDDSSIITINGGLTGGGRIDFATNPIAAISTVGGFNAGGNVLMVAYGGTRAGAGQIVLPDMTINTGSGGTDLNGSVTLIAGATSGTAITTGTINTQGASNGSGNIYMLTGAPSLSGCASCTGKMQIVDGKIISGSYNLDPANQPAGLASIRTGDLLSSGGAINLIAGGDLNTGVISTMGRNASGVNGGVLAFGDNLNLGTITAGGGAVKIFAEKALTTQNISNIGADNTGTNGGIMLVAGANSGTAITVGNVLTQGATNRSGDITILASNTFTNGTFCPTCAISSYAINTNGGVKTVDVTSAGNVAISAGSDVSAGAVRANGSGQTNGGMINILTNNNNSTATPFTIGGAGSNSVGSMTVAAGTAGAGLVGVTSRGAGGIIVADKTAINILQPSGNGGGGRIGLNATNGTLKIDGGWNVDGFGTGAGGLLNFAGNTIEFTNDVVMSANGGVNGGSGGTITVTANTLNLPTNLVQLSANGTGSNGSGGSVRVSSTTATNLGAGGINASAKGTGTGFGGLVQFGSNGTVNFNGGTATLDTSAGNMLAGRIDVFGGTQINVGTGKLNATSVSNGGGGGTVNLNAPTIAATSGTIALTTGSTPFNGGFINVTANDITTGAGAFTMTANSGEGFGGKVQLSANSISVGTGGMTATANGGIGGGFINANVNSTTGSGVLALNANGSGAFSGSGGTVFVTSAGTTPINIGTGAGQIKISATGYSANGGMADGGQVFASSGGNMVVNGAGINVGTTAADGNGGLISLSAGNSGQGTLTVTGDLNADGRGIGNGGLVMLQYQDANPFNATGSSGTPNVANITARALGSGLGGSIMVENTSQSMTSVGATNNGLMSVTSATGTAGNITVTSDIGQDVLINGSGVFQGAVTAIGRNVTVNVTNTAPFQVGELRSSGNLNVTAPTIELRDSNAVMASSGTTSLTASTITNNSNITSTGAMTISNTGNMSLAGTGTITAPTIAVSSTGGSAAVSQGKITGVISGSSATAYSVTTSTGDLAFGSVSAAQGNVSLVSNGGNLTINDGATIAANVGNVLIQNNSSTGIITLRPNASVIASSTTGVNGTGQVYIVSGGVPSSPTPGTTPSNMTVTLTNGGTIYFGSAGITSQCCNQQATVNGTTQVVFNTNDPNSIVLTSNNTISASNQAPAPPPPTGGGKNPGHGGTPPGLGGVTPPGQGGPNPGQGGTPPGQAKKETTTTTTTVPTDTSTSANSGSSNNGNGNGNGNGNNGNGKGQTKKAYAPEESDSEFVPVAFIQGSATIVGKRAEEVFGTQTATAFVKQSGSTDILTNSAQTLLLRDGDIVVATDKQTNVRAGKCTITVAPNAIVQITAHENGIVKVRNLFDGGRESVKIVVSEKQKMSLIAGQEAVVLENADIQRTAKDVMSEDRVGRRRVKQTEMEEGKLSVATCEYSLLSLIDDSAVLKQMFYKGAAVDRPLVDKMMKTAVALTTVTASHGVFSRVSSK